MTTMTVSGRLGRTAEVRYTSSGTAVADLSVPYNYGQRDADGNRPTQWVKASLWGKQAESLAPYLEKGKGVLLTLDDVHVREYQKNGGGTGYSLEGRVIKLEFLPVPREQSDQQAQQQAPQQAQQQRPVQQPQQQQQQQRAPQQQQSYQTASQGGYGDMDDDIPFAPYFSRNGYAF